MTNGEVTLAFESRPPTKVFAEKLKPTAETILGVVGNTIGNNHLDTLLELHRKLTPRHRSGWGRFRDGPAFICAQRRRVKQLVPPAEAIALAASAMAWLSKSRMEVRGTLKPSYVASEVIYLLLHAHPFADGNGRVARAMGTWVLIREGYELCSDVRLFCHERRERYFEAVSAREEWPDRPEPWNSVL